MKQEFYDSKDGTPVPIYIVHKKVPSKSPFVFYVMSLVVHVIINGHLQGLKKSGTSPVLLHGDGGLNRNLLPRYSVDILAFIELFGGVYAVPNVRGGGYVDCASAAPKLRGIVAWRFHECFCLIPENMESNGTRKEVV